MTTAQSLKDKIILVTGASRGIGYFASLALAEAGAHVLALARTVGGLEELDDAIKEQGGQEGGQATLIPQDLMDFDAIDRLGAVIFERWGRLDGFIGNAGYLSGLSPLGHISPKDWDKTIGINLTANWRLLRSFDPLLRQSEAGRVVLLTSAAANKASPFWGPYSVSKSGLETLAQTYAGEVKSTNINVALVNPGPLRTAMRATAMPGEDKDTLQHPSAISGELVRLCMTQNDKRFGYYDFPTKQFTELPLT